MHHHALFDHVYALMLVAFVAIRAPYDYRRKQQKTTESRADAKERLLLLLMFTGSGTMPLLYLFTPWFDFADYPVATAVGIAGTLLAVLGLYLFWKAHRDLGRQFSPTLELREQHHLVADGIYRRIRHPMYTAIFAIAIAQACLIGNFVVGPAMLVTFALLYLVRIDREEAMMLAHFGQAYADYQQRTGRLLPPLRR